MNHILNHSEMSTMARYRICFYRVPMFTTDLWNEMQDGVREQRADSKAQEDGHERLVAGALWDGEEEDARYSTEADNQSSQGTVPVACSKYSCTTHSTEDIISVHCQFEHQPSTG